MELFSKNTIYGWALIKTILLFSVILLGGCSTVTVNIQNPVDGSNVGSGTFELQTEIRSSGRCMGGERCAHTDWTMKIDGTTVCSGTGTGGSGTYGWCGNRMGDYCIFHWDNVNTSDIGNGTHNVEIVGSASCHRDGSDNITINIP